MVVALLDEKFGFAGDSFRAAWGCVNLKFDG